jgi:hypothetical protein
MRKYFFAAIALCSALGAAVQAAAQVQKVSADAEGIT